MIVRPSIFKAIATTVMSDESPRGNPLQTLLATVLFGGGAFYGYNHYGDSIGEQLSSLRGKVTHRSRQYETYRDAPVMIDPVAQVTSHADRWVLPEPSASPPGVSVTLASSGASVDAVAAGSMASGSPTIDVADPIDRTSHHARPLKIGSWALDGFGPTKLANSDVRRILTRVIRRYDILAVQQVASIERDLVPRLMDVINGPEHRYDFITGPPTGPKARGEQLIFIFDTTKVQVDRRHSYAYADPAAKWTYDPLVATFRAAEPAAGQAWTFTAINFRIDLSRAADEIAAVGEVVSEAATVRRGEDDIVLMGLFQADDQYLQSALGGGPHGSTVPAVAHRSTDVYDRYQTSNVLVDTSRTREYLGRGGVFDFRRHMDLSTMQAEAVTSHLPVFAEFTAHEGGEL